MATPQELETGYDCAFADNVKDYECPLCLHVTREPNLTSCCGQHFCQHCIQRAKATKKPCPFCNENSFTIILDKKQKRRVLDLKVYCENKHDSCIWVGDLRDLEQHLKEKCSVNCPNNCGQAILRLHIKQHQSKRCPKRPYTCKYCQLEGPYQDIEENHVSVCPKYPVSCPNECGVSCLKRDQLEQHLRECPLAIVECELREVGCQEKVRRKDLDRHMEQAARKHLTLSTNFLTKQAKDLQRQAKEIAKLQQENEQLKQEIRHHNEQQSKSKQHKTEITVSATLISDKLVHLNINYNDWIYSQSTHFNLERFKTLSGYTMEINLHKRRNGFFTQLLRSTGTGPINVSKYLYIELTHVQSPTDNKLKWPKTFSMKVRLLNRAGDYHHYEVSGDDLQVTKGGMNDQVRIDRDIMECPPHGVQYIVGGCIIMEITVAEKSIIN